MNVSVRKSYIESGKAFMKKRNRYEIIHILYDFMYCKIRYRYMYVWVRARVRVWVYEQAHVHKKNVNACTYLPLLTSWNMALYKVYDEKNMLNIEATDSWEAKI